MTRDGLIELDLAALAAGMLLTLAARVVWDPAVLSVSAVAAYTGFGLALGGPLILGNLFLAGLYGDGWHERHPLDVVAAVAWAAVVVDVLVVFVARTGGRRRGPAAVAPVVVPATMALGREAAKRRLARRAPEAAHADERRAADGRPGEPAPSA